MARALLAAFALGLPAAFAADTPAIGFHAMFHKGREWAVRADAPAPKASAGVEVIAHRGASHDAPENTLPAVALAWEQGADAAEFDVHVSKDGHPVVIHDKTTKRTAGADKPVAAQTLAELRALDAGAWKGPKFAGTKIPTLAETLAAVPAGKRLFLEVKSGPSTVPAILRAVKESGLTPAQLAVISFSTDVVAAVKKDRPDLPAYWIVSLQPAKGKESPTVEDLVTRAKAIRADGLDLSADPALTKAFAAKVKAAGLRLYAWTVDDAAEANRLAEAGVEGITTNRPGWLRERLK